MTYPGGKNGAGTYHKLINLMPPHDVYLEPFLGSGAVMRLKRPARLNVGMDLDASQLQVVAAELVNSGVDGAIAVCDGRAARGLELNSSPLTMEASSAVSGDGIPSRVPAMLEYRLFRGCAIAALELASPDLARQASLVYCDPPYLKETRKGRDLYEYEMSDLDHRRLLRCIRKLSCMVMISGYWSSLYAEMLEGWNVYQFESMTRRGPATETVWYNYPTPVELHDYRYLGTGFRERERIKRKKQRWVNRLKRLPVLERQALLAALSEVAMFSGSGTVDVQPVY